MAEVTTNAVETPARRHSRVPVCMHLSVRATDHWSSDVARDLSISGIGVDTEVPLRPDTLVSMTFELPLGKGSVAVLGRVVWSGGRAMGIRFIEGHDEVEETVNRLQRAMESN